MTNLASIGWDRWLGYTKTTNHATQKEFDKVGSSASNRSQIFGVVHGIFHLNGETYGERLLYRRLNLNHSQKDKRATILFWSDPGRQMLRSLKSLKIENILSEHLLF